MASLKRMPMMLLPHLFNVTRFRKSREVSAAQDSRMHQRMTCRQPRQHECQDSIFQSNRGMTHERYQGKNCSSSFGRLADNIRPKSEANSKPTHFLVLFKMLSHDLQHLQVSW